MLIQHAAPFNVQRVADEGMLLPEENPGSYYLDDALHWILVYTELRQFTASMIVASEREAESLSFAGRVDAEIDRNMLRVHDERYRRRCEYWYGRASELSDENREEPPQASPPRRGGRMTGLDQLRDGFS